MESILTVTTAATSYDLTTLDRIKRELNIADGASDLILTDLIHEESAGFADLCGRVFASETVSEQFRRVRSGLRLDYLILTRHPVSVIATVTEDADAALASTLYEINAETGVLYRLDGDGRRTCWTASKTVVAYTAGYVLLTGLPRKVEAAVITMIKNRWFARARDPSVKSQDIVDVGRWEYWVGPIGDGLPPDVQDAIDLYRDIPI